MRGWVVEECVDCVVECWWVVGGGDGVGGVGGIS